MTDLISREAAIEEIARRDTTNGTVKVYSGLEVNAILSDLPAVDAIPVDWLRKKMQKPLITCGNPFDYVLSTWQDEQRKETQDDCNYNDE